ncbi:iron-sulfur cluster assembly scaffold protein [Chloroflexota bacterium]
MVSGFDNLEEEIMTDLRSAYTETVVDHAVNPRNVGSIPNPDGFATVTGSCGDTVQIWLRVKDDVVADVTFWTDGCGATIASGSMVTELARGKNIISALKVSQQDVLNALDGLPEGNHHCALLAANTLKEAVRDYLAYKKEPWKKAYRKH